MSADVELPNSETVQHSPFQILKLHNNILIAFIIHCKNYHFTEVAAFCLWLRERTGNGTWKNSVEIANIIKGEVNLPQGVSWNSIRATPKDDVKDTIHHLQKSHGDLRAQNLTNLYNQFQIGDNYRTLTFKKKALKFVDLYLKKTGKTLAQVPCTELIKEIEHKIDMDTWTSTKYMIFCTSQSWSAFVDSMNASLSPAYVEIPKGVARMGMRDTEEYKRKEWRTKSLNEPRLKFSNEPRPCFLCGKTNHQSQTCGSLGKMKNELERKPHLLQKHGRNQCLLHGTNMDHGSMKCLWLQITKYI